MNWIQFRELLLDRFPEVGAHDTMDQFQQLKQQTTVNVYIDTFEEWMTMMKKDHNYLPEHFFTLRFITGLKETIKHAVKTHKPPDLRSAFWYARQEDQAYLAVNKRHNTISVTNRPPTGNQIARPPPPREQRPKPVPNRNKEKGQCWYCPEQWSFGHKCEGMKSIIHALEMQGHSDDEEDEEVAALVEAQQEIAPPPLAVIQQPPPVAIQQPPVGQPPDKAHLMQLSLQALHGMPGEGTLSVQIHIAGKTAMALIDTGSTNTFLDSEFVQAHGLQRIPIPSRTVTVAGGGELACQFLVPECSYKLQDTEFTNDFHV
jgi:hypothetical protein